MVDTLTSFRLINLVTLFLQSVLYGIYIVTCGNCAVAVTRVNGRWRRRREMQWPFLLAGTFLLINATCNLCFQFYRCLELLWYTGPSRPGITTSFSRWINVAKVRYAP